MKNKGFSLVEMLIVVGIIGIMSAIAGLAYKSWTDKYNVERQTKEMYVDLMKARVNAMSRGRVFCVDFATTSYTIKEDTQPVSTDGDGVCTTAGDRTVMTKTLSSNYGVTLTDPTVTTVRFGTKGNTIAGKKTIYVTTPYGAAYDCIVIDDFRINMGAWNGTSCVDK